jgi:hypothetical protein
VATRYFPKRGAGDWGVDLGDVDDFHCVPLQPSQIYFRWRPMLPDPDEIVFWR